MVNLQMHALCARLSLMRVFVLANSEKEYADWCHIRGVNQSAATCVLNPRSLRGQIAKGDQVIDARPGRVQPVDLKLAVFSLAPEQPRHT